MAYPRSLAEIAAAETALVARFPTLVTRIPFTDASFEGRPMHSLTLAAGTGTGRVRVLFVGGIHARELAPPAAILQLADTLCTAYTASTGITLGGFSVTAADVKRVLDRCDLHLLPMANPDGRHYNVTVDPLWRKSRGPLNCPDAKMLGTDINRNFDVAWDFLRYYDATGERDVQTSDQPCHYEIYAGPAGARQPETQNVVSLIDGKQVQWYVDVHSFGRKILYPWGMETNGADPAMNFLNPAWDNRREGPAGATYKEYFPTWAAQHIVVGNLMRDAIRLATGATYSVEQSCSLYPTTGTSEDYAFSRNFPASTRRVFAYTIECGSSGEGGFQPTPVQYPTIESEVQAALLRLLLHATAAPSGSGASSPGVPAGAGSSAGSASPSGLCLLADVVYGGTVDPEVAFLRSWRDRRLRPRAAGRAAIAAYGRISPPLSRWLAGHPGVSRAVRDRAMRPLVRFLHAFGSRDE